MKNISAKSFGASPDETVSPTTLLGKDVIAALSVITPCRSSLTIAADWLMIIGAAVLCSLYFSIPLYLLTVLFIGGRFYGLVVMMHEAAHYRLFANRTLNDWVGELLCALPLPGMTLYGYRSFHIKHHQYVNTMQDPEWEIVGNNPFFGHPKARQAIYLDLLKAILGGFFISNGQRMSKSNDLKNIPAKLKWIRISLYLVFLACSLVFGFFGELVLYWMIPIITSFSFILYVRVIAEHDRSTVSQDEVLSSSRHINANWLENLFFPHNISYHLDHHLYPSVPFYNLPKLHKELLSLSNYSNKAHITDGYLKVLFRESVKDAI